MSFDHQGRRRAYLETATDGSTNHIDHFTYDNYLCVARNRWQPGGTIATDRFVWDPTEPVVTRPLVFYQPNAPSQLYAHDGNKNISDSVASDVTIVVRHEYSSFGKVVLVTSENEYQLSANLNPYRFSRFRSVLGNAFKSRDPVVIVSEICGVGERHCAQWGLSRWLHASRRVDENGRIGQVARNFYAICLVVRPFSQLGMEWIVGGGVKNDIKAGALRRR